MSQCLTYCTVLYQTKLICGCSELCIYCIFYLLLGFKCTLDGYFPDPTDCRRFYRCSGQTQHAFSCPVGLGFNSDKIKCDPMEEILQCGLEGFLKSDSNVNEVKDLMVTELKRGIPNFKFGDTFERPGDSYGFVNYDFNDLQDGGNYNHDNQYTDLDDYSKAEYEKAKSAFEPWYPVMEYDEKQIQNHIDVPTDLWTEYDSGPMYPDPSDASPDTIFPWGDPNPNGNTEITNNNELFNILNTVLGAVTQSNEYQNIILSDGDGDKSDYDPNDVSEIHLPQRSQRISTNGFQVLNEEIAQDGDMNNGFDERYGKQAGTIFRNKYQQASFISSGNPSSYMVQY